jgi:HNH endonuclease
VMNEKASIIAADGENPVFGSSGMWDRPSVIILRRYVRVPSGHNVPVSRRGVLRRDGHRCMYCNGTANTIDHVLPRSRGGNDSWENLVACCLKCNNQKGDRTAAEMSWKLRSIPRAPHGVSWLVRGIERALPDWEEFLAPAA